MLIRRLVLLVAALAALTAWPAAGAAALAAPAAGFAALPASGLAGLEEIRDYRVSMELSADASMRVEETIAYDFGSATDRHGIFRTIPTVFAYGDDGSKERVYELDDVEVSSPTGAPDEVEVENGNVTGIRIGDPDETVSGQQTYVIGYTVRGVVNSFPDHQELYWNAIGDEWDVGIAAASATVSGPAAVTQAACFRGSQGSTQTCTQRIASGGAEFAAQDLQPAQGMTVVASFPPGTFPGAAPIVRDRQTFARAFSVAPETVAGSVAVLGLVGGGAAALVSRRGRDERYLGVTPGLEPGRGQEPAVARVPLTGRDPVAVQFQPPAGMRPGQLGTLIDERANVVDVTATIIDLAVRGFLRIEEVEQEGWFRAGDWRLVMLPAPAGDELHDYELRLLQGIFDQRDQVLLSEIKQTFASDLSTVQDMLYADVTRAGWFKGNPSSVRTRWQVYGVLLILLGIGLTVLLAVLRTRFGLVGVALAVAGLVVLVLAPRMPARTARGTAMLAQAKGFREYLVTAEADQIRFEEGEDVFSRYLPYAIVFGVAERWARVFEQLAASGRASFDPPSWYVGSALYAGAFNYGAFGHSMDTFSTETAGAIAAATPSSSGGSGFGGGGFSGGGGGGGGGGSW